MMLGSIGLLAFAMWIRVQDERRRKKEAQSAGHEAFSTDALNTTYHSESDIDRPSRR